MIEKDNFVVRLGGMKQDGDTCAPCENVPDYLPKDANKLRLGTDGKPMSVWQIWLRRLCIVMIVWAALELVFGIVFWAVGWSVEGLQIAGVELKSIAASVGSTALVSAALNLVIALLGIRGAKNPCKITLFFWITLADAVLTAWAMASNIASGIIDVTGMISGLFIIALAVCTWQVRGQTGYFDEHP